jgi:hypothetical protein
MHPRLMPALVEWAARQGDSTSPRACNLMRELTKLDFSTRNLDPLNEWWRTARTILERDYDLSRPEGVSAWLDAYHSADKACQEILSRMWLFERTIPEEYLFGLAQSENEAQAAKAKAALAMLWRFDRLSPEMRQSIVEQFMPLRLVEIPIADNFSGSRELRVVGQRSFPYPESAWTEFRTEWTMSDLPRTIGMEGGWNSRSLDGEGAIELGSLGGGSHFGEPTVSVVFYMREYDHRMHEVVWTNRWNLGPIKLRYLPKR